MDVAFFTGNCPNKDEKWRWVFPFKFTKKLRRLSFVICRSLNEQLHYIFDYIVEFFLKKLALDHRLD